MKKIVFYKAHGAGNDFIIISSAEKLKIEKSL
jgi:diaminopimelate epimerase